MVVSPKRKTREKKRRWVGERIVCFSFRFPGSCFSSVDRIYSTEETSCLWRSEGGGSFCCLLVALEICSSITRYWHQLEFTSLPTNPTPGSWNPSTRLQSLERIKLDILPAWWLCEEADSSEISFVYNTPDSRQPLFNMQRMKYLTSCFLNT